jgi:hypothetical protein
VSVVTYQQEQRVDQSVTIEDRLREWIRDRLADLGHGQDFLADALGVSQGTVSLRIGGGQRRSSLSPDSWAEMVELLGGVMEVSVSLPGEHVPTRHRELGELAKVDDKHFEAILAFARMYPFLTPREREMVTVIFSVVRLVAKTRAEAGS